MSGYDLMMKPLEKRTLDQMRREYIKEADGKVVELGSGTGINLKYYNFKQIDSIHLTDLKLNKSLLKKVKALSMSHKISVAEVNAEALPYEDHSIDTVVATLLYCSVEDVNKGLQEIKRILKPEGKLIFIEHVLPHNHSLAKAFDKVTPLWKTVANGCHLNRKFEDSLMVNGYKVKKSSHANKGIFYSGVAQIDE